jgi:hypothetical protein
VDGNLPLNVGVVLEFTDNNHLLLGWEEHHLAYQLTL